MGIKRHIERFVEGDSTRTAFSAGVMNEIVDTLNSVAKIRGVGPIKVTTSDAEYVISFSGSFAGSGSYTPPSDGNTTVVSSSVVYCLCRYA